MPNTTLPTFLEHHTQNKEGVFFLGIMSNGDQTEEIAKLSQQFTPDVIVDTAQFDDPGVIVNIPSLIGRDSIKARILVIGIPFHIFDVQWTRLVAQSKKMKQSENVQQTVVLNIYDMDSVYDVITNLKEITTVYYNCDVSN